MKTFILKSGIEAAMFLWARASQFTPQHERHYRPAVMSAWGRRPRDDSWSKKSIEAKSSKIAFLPHGFKCLSIDVHHHQIGATMTSSTNVIQVTNVSPSSTAEQMRTLFGFIGTIDELKLFPPEWVEMCSESLGVQYREHFTHVFGCLTIPQCYR